MQKNEITEKEIKATPPKIQEDINLAAPGKLRVIKRNGKVVAFDEEKIKELAEYSKRKEEIEID